MSIKFPKVAPEDADTYKCFATNAYGRAVCTVVLNVIAGETPYYTLLFTFFLGISLVECLR